jgi:hypothetical protein
VGAADDRRRLPRRHGLVPLWVLAFSAPYALLVTSVLFGKHIDKIEPDTKLGIRTVPSSWVSRARDERTRS